MKVGALIAALLLPGALWAQVSGLVALEDRTDLLGWEAIGRLDFDGGGFCTGTLIASDLVLTAAHCAYRAGETEPRPPEGIRFRAGLAFDHAIAERSVRQVTVHPDYRPMGRNDMANIARDVALLRLDTPVSTTDADPFGISPGETVRGDVTFVSYGEGRANTLSRQKACHMQGRTGDVFVFDCTATFGSSGAPVFARSGGRLRILSIISGGAETEDGTLAFGMRLPQAVALLKTRMRVEAARPEPRLRRIGVGDGHGDTGAKFVRP